jgi:hypothetical protein
VGYDLDPAYVALARRRVAEEGTPSTQAGAGPAGESPGGALALTRTALEAAGFRVLDREPSPRPPLQPDLWAKARPGTIWAVVVAGPDSTFRPGVERPGVLVEAIGHAAVIAGALGPAARVLVATPRGPANGSSAARAVAAATPQPVSAFVDLRDPGTPEVLRRLASAGATGELPA